MALPHLRSRAQLELDALNKDILTYTGIHDLNDHWN
jgi:hypothetical protein